MTLDASGSGILRLMLIMPLRIAPFVLSEKVAELPHNGWKRLEIVPPDDRVDHAVPRAP